MEAEAPQSIAELASDPTTSASEYRAAREGKAVADVVAEREPVAAAADGSEIGETQTAAAVAERARDEAGRFAKPAEGQAKAPNPRKDPDARKASIQAEIDALTKQKGETQRERDAIATELATLRAERDALKPKPATTDAAKPADGEKFTFAPFDAWLEKHPEGDYDAYIEDRAVARVRHENAIERRQEDTEKAAREAHERTWKPYSERQAAFRARTPNYDEVLRNSPVFNTPMPPWIGKEIADNERGPEIEFMLLQRPDDVRWLLQQPPSAAVDYIRSLVSSSPAAASTVTAPVIPQTKADPPLETVGVSATASTRSLTALASSGDVKAYRRARESGVGL